MPISQQLRAVCQAPRLGPIATARRAPNTTDKHVVPTSKINPVLPITNFKVNTPRVLNTLYSPQKLNPFEEAGTQALGRHLACLNAFANTNRDKTETESKTEDRNLDSNVSVNKTTEATKPDVDTTIPTTTATPRETGDNKSGDESNDDEPFTRTPPTSLVAARDRCFLMLYVGVTTYAYLVAIHDRSTDEYLEDGLWKPPTL